MATGLLSNQSKDGLVLSQGTFVLNTKFGMLPNNKVMDVYPCCHSNKVFLATTDSIDQYCHKGHVYKT